MQWELLIPLLIIISSMFTLNIVYNGSAGEMPVITKSYKYIVIYTIFITLICSGLLLFFPTLENNKLFYMYHIVFIGYLLASYSMYVASQTVSISLI